MRRHPSLVPLSHQHQHGLALTVLIERGLADEPSTEKVRELRRQALALADLELGGHFKVEEQVVFPAVREALESSDLVDELVEQHREMEALSEKIRQAREDELVAVLADFGRLLRRHIRLEERELFEQLQNALSREAIEQLGKRVASDLSRVCPSTQTLPWDAAQ